MASASTQPTAADLAEPLRVAVGSGDSIATVQRRLALHGAGAAIVVRRGRPWGVIDVDTATSAVRHGLADVACEEITGPGPATVGPTVTLGTLHRASLSTCPGIVVARPDGTVLGIVPRGKVAREVWAAGQGRGRRMPRHGRQVSGLLETHLGGERSAQLETAAGIAREAKTPLYLVGGIVRDLLIGAKVADLDLVVEGDGLEFAGVLAERLGASVRRHRAFGTAVLTLASGARIDVATARRESYQAPAALPAVRPGSVHDDLFRRDLTINSMAIRLEGPLHGLLRDDLGGRADLMSGRLKIHHKLSIIEDPTRALRIARFAGRFGFKPSRETLDGLDLAKRFGAFDHLTGERLFREFGHIATEPDPVESLDWLSRLDLLPVLGPGLTWDRATRGMMGRLTESLRENLWSGVERVPEFPLLALMVLMAGSRPSQREAVAKRLKIGGEARKRLVGMGRPIGRLRRVLGSARLPSKITRACEAAPAEALMLVWASSQRGPGKKVEAYLSTYRTVRPALSGRQLKELGLEEGPRYGRILAALREARLDGRVEGKEDERRLARELVDSTDRKGGRGGD